MSSEREFHLMVPQKTLSTTETKHILAMSNKSVITLWLKSACEPSVPSGLCLSQFQYYDVTSSIFTPPGWDASPSQS